MCVVLGQDPSGLHGSRTFGEMNRLSLGGRVSSQLRDKAVCADLGGQERRHRKGASQTLSGRDTLEYRINIEYLIHNII